MFKRGDLPNAYQLPSGTILVEDVVAQQKQEHVVVYARVSSSENKPNLDKQARRLTRYANAKGYTVAAVVKEVGSGLNDKRPKLLKILADDRCTHLIVEHKDRLARFGVEYIKLLCATRKVELVIVNAAETDESDLMQDFVSIVTSFCARLYGLRRGKRKTEQLIRELEHDDPTR